MSKCFLGYFELYSKLVDDYENHNKYNKQRLIKKHCNMAESNAIKKYPRMRKMERGKKVYTYKIGEYVYFTSKPKQKSCTEYSVHKVTLICKQGRRDFC
jgi:hypothetical protein